MSIVNTTSPWGGGTDRHPLVEAYLADLGRLRPAAVARVAADLDDFFSSMTCLPLEVTVLDVLVFATSRNARPAKLAGRCLHDGDPVPLTGLLRNVSRFYQGLLQGAETPAIRHPVPEILADRRSRRRVADHDPPRPEGATLVDGSAVGRAALAGAATARDRAILTALLYGGLRVSEVVGLRLGDVKAVDELVVVTGHRGLRRIVPVVSSFFDAVDEYLAEERPAGLGTTALFVAKKGRNRGTPLGAEGIRDVVARSCNRGGLPSLSAGRLRRVGLDALRTAGMSRTALRAFAGQALPPDAVLPWSQVNEEYRRAARQLAVD